MNNQLPASPRSGLPSVSFETNGTGFLSLGLGVTVDDGKERKRMYCRVHDVIIASANRHCHRQDLEPWAMEKRPPMEDRIRGQS